MGKCLRLAQELKEIKSADLARGLNVLPQQVLRWRQQKNMRLHQVQAIAAFFSMSVDEFVALEKL